MTAIGCDSDDAIMASPDRGVSLYSRMTGRIALPHPILIANHLQLR
uniref:Uncharacterized protein n=1 Tax=Bosea sp. NBC_00436 TaxID=2969620 RepID=A0A9E8CLD0_9HYPH